MSKEYLSVLWSHNVDTPVGGYGEEVSELTLDPIR